MRDDRVFEKQSISFVYDFRDCSCVPPVLGFFLLSFPKTFEWKILMRLFLKRLTDEYQMIDDNCSLILNLSNAI